MQLQVFNSSTIVIDKTFTSRGTATKSTGKTGQTVYKLKSGKDSTATNALAKFSYDSGSGKLQLGLKNLTLAACTSFHQHQWRSYQRSIDHRQQDLRHRPYDLRIKSRNVLDSDSEMIVRFKCVSRSTIEVQPCEFRL